jgi:hypothetical protein
MEHPQAPVLRLTRVRYGDHDCPQSFEEVAMPLGPLLWMACDGDSIPDISELAKRHGLSLRRATAQAPTATAARDRLSSDRTRDRGHASGA